ncbi:unnamed protein product, partial [Mesorhabditis spiculigera]
MGCKQSKPICGPVVDDEFVTVQMPPLKLVKMFLPKMADDLTSESDHHEAKKRNNNYVGGPPYGHIIVSQPEWDIFLPRDRPGCRPR